MQSTKILPLIGLVLVSLATLCTYALPRVPIATIHKVPVEDFPTTLGEWKASENIPTSPEVQKIIPTAKIVTRQYTNTEGQSVEMTLLSASRREDFHNPNECFPGQGWALSDHHEVVIQNQRFNVMTAEKDRAKRIVLYNWLGAREVAPPTGGIAQAAFKLRQKVFSSLMDRADGMSVFVRLLTDSDEKSQLAMRQLAERVLPEVKQMLEQHAK